MLKKTPKTIFLKCIGENEAYLAVSNIHSGTCGAHQVVNEMSWLLCHQGVYWPTMLKYCIEFSKGCQECQMHVGIQHVPASESHAIVKSWPFRGWDLDLIGEILSSSLKSQKYIFVGIGYFIKWIKVVPLVNIDQVAKIDFIQRHIIYRFGIPETITTY